MMLRTPVCSYPIIVTHLSFNFLCLLLLYSIYLNGCHTRGHTYTVHRDRQDIDTTESPSPPFLEELQTAMASRSPPPKSHYSSLAPTTYLARGVVASPFL